MKNQTITMKKLNIFGALVAAGIMMASCGGNHETASNETKIDTVETKVDIAASSLQWKGTMLGVYSHEGTINLTEATLQIADSAIVGGSFVVDMATMMPTDQNYDSAAGHTPEVLVGHLSTADFFDVPNNPTAKFEITSVAAGALKGNLTVRGVTNEENVENVVYDAATKTATGTLVFDRKKYGVAYESTMKDMVLSNDIELKVTLKAI